MSDLKYEAARAALSEVASGMSLGLGTGSTAAAFVKLLGEEIREKRLTDIRCVCTSSATEGIARALRIPLATLEELAPLSLSVDGADEIDPALRLIKGRGGALLREKIVEQASERFIVIADESKLVERLGVGALPVEVVPFAVEILMRSFERIQLEPVLRMDGVRPLVTDEGHRIIDVIVPQAIQIDDVVEQICAYAGVVETGFFPNEAHSAAIAGADGVRWMRKS
jgi:ribose 5-phosphate isomerase A